MGRAGSTSRGGGHSSGGGHRAGSRSGGGHRVSTTGSRRAGSSSSYGSHGGPPPGGRRPGYAPPPPPRPYFGPRRRRYYGGAYVAGGGGTVMAVVVIVIFLVVVFALMNAGGSGVKSTIVRERLDTGDAYVNDCIVDELGWFDNVSGTEADLKEFWDETGVQPYIILRTYDAELVSDASKEAWAKDYYDANFSQENIFLYVYFAEEDSDGDIGYMAYANGSAASSVMDAEAVEIFWNYIDRYWTTDMSTDDVFASAFTDTADAIMHVAATRYDAYKWIAIAVIAIGGGILIVWLVKKRSQRAREEAEEKQRILETPLDDLVDERVHKDS